jgi:predicted nuclease of restriction endonuclease-like (RecB) superfamily
MNRGSGSVMASKKSKNSIFSFAAKAGGQNRLHRGKRKKDILFPVSPQRVSLPKDYALFLSDLKKRIQQERLRVVLASNAALVNLYWYIGGVILKKQSEEGWGAKVIDRLSADLGKAFPDMKGFSPRNLKYMRAFAAAWPEKTIVQRVIAQIPWRSNIALLDKLEKPEVRLWYAKKILEHGWSQPILCLQVDARAHEREGRATNNFSIALPPADSDLVKQVFKDPYLFDFLGTADLRREAELEEGLMDHLQKFLQELGAGFAFVGRQVHLELGENDFYIDLLFYHLRLRCYVAIELKVGKLEPGHIGQLNMYMSVVDDILKHPQDKPTIGLLLVRQKNKLMAEYALRGYAKPIGIAQWETQITRALPKALKTSLPTIKAIEDELSRGRGAGCRN